MKVIINGVEKSVKSWVFPDGSVGVRIEDSPRVPLVADIFAAPTSPTEQIELMMVANALRELSPLISINLYLEYCPYARQDQVFVPGEANGMKAWAGFINSLKCDTVQVLDPHSVAIGMIENLEIVDQVSIIRKLPISVRALLSECTLVSPDAGANKKAHKLCEEFGIRKLIRADKARDLATGEILETVVYGDPSGQDCVIVDDICDGGMTFIKLGGKLKELGAKSVTLMVTHGLFTKGLGVFEGIIDSIYTPSHLPEASSGEYKGNYIRY